MNAGLQRLIQWFIPQKRQELLRRLIVKHANAQKKKYALAGIAMIVVALSTAMTAFLMEHVVDAMTAGEDRSKVFLVAAAVASTFFLKGMANYIQTVSLSRAGNRIVADQQKELFRNLVAYDVSFFSQRESSNLLMRLTNGARASQTVIELIVASLLRDGLMLIGLLGVMIYQAPVLSIIALMIGPAIVFGVRSLVKRVKDIIKNEMASGAEIIKVVQETSKGIQVVKAFSLEEHLQTRMDNAVDTVEKRRNALARVGAVTSPLMETLAGLAIAGVVIVSTFALFGQEPTSPGQLLSFITAFMMAYEPTKRLSRLRVKLEAALVRVRMMFEILDYEESMTEAPDASPLTPGNGEVRLEDVTFGYKDGVPILNGLDITFQADRMSALVGPSGGGKSTILNLVMRLYDPNEGRVLVDGQDMRGATFASIRDRISYVGQDTFLFSASVMENIRLGRPSATDDEVMEAARTANAHDFIMQLPDGYDTEVGENGIFLSGGQRQRLAIARAVLRRSDILLLDEATSALDSHSETTVKEAIARLTEGVTTIVIAHRLSTILEADEVFFIEEGRVAESGGVHELLAANGRFRALYDKQFEGVGDALEDL